MIDRTTKILLAAIAVGLWANLARFFQRGPGCLRAAPPRGTEGRAARRLPRLTICSAGAKCNRRDATALATAAAANGAVSAATVS